MSRHPAAITFVGTVGEEGLGDLRGVKHLFNTELKGRIDRFVSVDGAGMGITHIGVGSLRYRVAFKGPGGHSYGAFGIANPMHALGRAIAKIAELQVPASAEDDVQRGTGRRRHVRERDRGGGVDGGGPALERRAALTALDAGVSEVTGHCARGGKRAVGEPGTARVERAIVGNRPAGRAAADAPIVQAAVAVTRALGLTCRSRKAPPTQTSG